MNLKINIFLLLLSVITLNAQSNKQKTNYKFTDSNLSELKLKYKGLRNKKWEGNKNYHYYIKVYNKYISFTKEEARILKESTIYIEQLSITIYHQDFKIDINLPLLQKKSSKEIDIEMSGIDAESLNFSNDFAKFIFGTLLPSDPHYDFFKELHNEYNKKVKKNITLLLSSCSFDEIQISGYLKSFDSGYLECENANFTIKETNLIRFYKFSFKKNCTLDLSNNELRSVYVDFTKSNIDKIKEFDYSYCKTDIYNKFISTKKHFQKILKNQKENDYLNGLKYINIDYEEHNRNIRNESMLSFISKYWWSYGYEKEKVFKNTIIIFLFMCLINTLFLPYMNKRVYRFNSLNNFIKKTNKHHFFKLIYASTYYTGLIFFGLRFKIEKLDYFNNLNLKKIFAVIWFFTIYSIGLICIGFIANVIFN